MTFSRDQAETIGKLLGLSSEAVRALQVMPYKRSLPTAVPTDPLIFRKELLSTTDKKRHDLAL